MNSRFLAGLLLMAGVSSTALAQDAQNVADTLSQKEIKKINRQKKIWEDRSSYFNISYSKQDMEQAEQIEVANYDWGKMESDWAVGISSGFTRYLHKRPILGMIKFGFDWTVLDLNVACYKPIVKEVDIMPDEILADLKDKTYKAEVGMQFGPSITINPFSHLKISGYFRVQPSYSAFYDGSDLYSAYGTYFNYGGAIAFKAISVGVEQRWGESKFRIKNPMQLRERVKTKIKTEGPRVYLSIRF